MSSISRLSTRRTALGEATDRVNNSQAEPAIHPLKNAPIPHHESRGTISQIHNSTAMPPPLRSNTPVPQRSSSSVPTVPNPRLSQIVKEEQLVSKRDSQASSASASLTGRIKVCVGPWRLGRTLGYGATARVRLAKHIQTGQKAAVKIVLKRNAVISQAGSLADLERADLSIPEEDGVRRMPIGIEREVAIMKLIQHPNIMKLYDIWENRTEIYLVLEFVENGELFDRISSEGRLSEAEGMKYFRQIISALGYCHSFNICHRDLKPENILLSGDGDVKIADFGMAALQQGPDYKLRTSCGSPHYAAPELVKGLKYRGNQVDIWSMGVILYAMLAGRLPFDAQGGKDLQPLLKIIRRGHFTMAEEISPDAADLIRRMLTVNPKDRISIPQIWRHPAVQRYDYVDDLGKGNYPQSPSAKDYARPVARRSEICKDLVRQLRSMWHTLSEEQLINELLSEEPNDQKLFYSLLLKHREALLENYMPDLEYSNSDYHHIRPTKLTKTYSTRQFSQAPSRGHVQQTSKFTVISNSAETDRSYDPFKASRPQRLYESGSIKITIHRNEDDKQSQEPSASIFRKSSGQSSRLLAPPRYSSSGTRSSLASSVKGTTGAPYVRPASRYKRGVSFNHLRSSTGSMGSPGHSIIHSGRHSNHTEVTDDGGDSLRPVTMNRTPPSTRYIRSREAHPTVSQTGSPAKKAVRSSLMWGEDFRQLSSSLAKDCDEAFNRVSIASYEESIIDFTLYHPKQESTDSTTKNSSSLPESSLPSRIYKLKRNELDDRPLPRPPARTESIKIELEQQKRQFELRKELEGASQQGHLDRMVNHLDELMRMPSSVTGERRASSAPLDSRQKTRQLASIHECGGEYSSPPKPKEQAHRYTRSEAQSSRIASAPEPRDISRETHHDDRFARHDPSLRDTIRVVPDHSSQRPEKIPAPRTIRKKSSLVPRPPWICFDSGEDRMSSYDNHRPSGQNLRQQYNMRSRDAGSNLAPITERRYDEEQFTNDAASNAGTVVRKKSGWFRRNSKASDDSRLSTGGSETQKSNKSSVGGLMRAPSDRSDKPTTQPQPPISPPKKKGIFGNLFKKRPKADMEVSNHDIHEDEASFQGSVADNHQSHTGRVPNIEEARDRQVAPQQNWLAKLFRVKPATRYICFSVSQRRARKDIVAVLRDWKKYGMRDIQVDKPRNIVFARVGPKNYLDIKEVSIAGEIMTVIEHGKRSQLSIVRFTQEQGAASSFNKVLDTLENVLHVKGLLVKDVRKAKMMIKTLNSA